MGQSREITIDLNKWCIPSKLAENFGVSNQVVNNWRERGRLEVWNIEELGLTLVRVKTIEPKKRKKKK